MFELMESHADVEYTIRASYLEVYNEKVCVVTFVKSIYKSEVHKSGWQRKVMIRYTGNLVSSTLHLQVLDQFKELLV